jgi:addiction module RelE/StbE family toxin
VKVIWSPEALEDVGRTFDYLALLNPVAAKRVVESLFVAAESLINFPQRGRIGSKPGTRELVVQTPYVIVYRITGDTVDILRVWHAAQER